MTVLDDYNRAQNELPEMWVLGEVSSPKLSCFLKLCPMMQYSRSIAKILSRNFNDLARCLCSSRVLFVKKLTELGMGTEDYLKEHQNINSSLGGEGGKGGRSCFLFHLLLLLLSHFLHPGPTATETLHLRPTCLLESCSLIWLPFRAPILFSPCEVFLVPPDGVGSSFSK